MVSSALVRLCYYEFPAIRVHSHSLVVTHIVVSRSDLGFVPQRAFHEFLQKTLQFQVLDHVNAYGFWQCKALENTCRAHQVKRLEPPRLVKQLLGTELPSKLCPVRILDCRPDGSSSRSICPRTQTERLTRHRQIDRQRPRCKRRAETSSQSSKL